MNKNIFNTSYAIELDKNSSMYKHSKLFHYPVKKNKKMTEGFQAVSQF